MLSQRIKTPSTQILFYHRHSDDDAVDDDADHSIESAPPTYHMRMWILIVYMPIDCGDVHVRWIKYIHHEDWATDLCLRLQFWKQKNMF